MSFDNSDPLERNPGEILDSRSIPHSNSVNMLQFMKTTDSHRTFLTGKTSKIYT